MKKFSLSISLGHGQCQNQWLALFPLSSKTITGQRSVRLRRYKTACCSRLSRPQAGTALEVPESALTFIWAILLPSPGVPIIPCLLPIKRRLPYFPSNESSEEWNNSFPFQWIVRWRRDVHLPLWGSPIQQRSRSILSATPACACAVYLCAHTFGGQGSQTAQCYTVMLWLLPLPMENAVAAGMTQLPSSFYWKHAENVKKNKNSRSSSEMWTMPLNSCQPR